ncbi:MAG TPA: hypothetical protein VGR18_12200 [Rubrobacter sp.]|nr:hypothetical protein [Rubrobacter sp.]
MNSMGFLEYLGSRWDDLPELSIEHAQVVLVSLLVATATRPPRTSAWRSSRT